MSRAICPQCGNSLPAGVAEAACPKCLLSLGVMMPQSSTGGSHEMDSLEQAGTRIGRFRLLEEIGEGAFGTVWMAEQEQPIRRRVALKIIKLGMDTRNVIARFEAERQALAMMDHPNIAQVFDGGATESGRPYFVMELVRGVPLTQFCDARQLNTRERIELFITVCDAVQHAHQKGIIHRDLKPSNILVTEQDGRPLPKVIDFGIAKATGQQLTDKTLFTHFQQFMGTPAYMSPEQTGLGLDIDTRSDVYSLGVLFYEMVAGSTPFDAQTLLMAGTDAVQRTIREVEPPKPSTQFSTLRQEELLAVAARRREAPAHLKKVLRGDLDWIALKALQKDRNKRYASARELAEDLKHFLADEPITAGPPSVANRLGKAWRRNRLLYGAMLAVAFALVAGLTVSTWMAIRESRSSRQVRSTAAQLRDNLYASEMGNAFRAWQEGRVFQARTLLEKQIPEPRSGARDLRGFDWRYLWSLTRPGELLSLPNAACWGLAVAPDGRTFAGRGLDHVMRVWNLEERREISTLTNVTFVFSASFSPDGSMLAFPNTPASFTNASVEIWNVSSRTLARSIPLKNPGLGITFSSDGKLLLSSGGLMYNRASLGEIRLWDSTNGREIFASEEIPSWGFQCAFSPDDRFFAVSCGDGVVRIWDVSSKSLVGELPGHNGFTAAVTFTADGNHLAIGDEGGYYWIWQWRQQRPERVIKAHDGPIYSIVFTKDGTRMVTASRDYSAKLWDTSTAGELKRFTGHRGGVTAAHVLPDDSAVLTASQDGVAKLWSLKAERSGNVIATNRDSAGIVFVARGRHLARIERGIKRLTFFDVKSGAELKTMEAAEVASSPDGTVLVAVHGSELIFLDQDSLAEIARMECGKVLGGKPSISPDNNWLALRGGDQTGDLAETDVLIVDIRNRKIERLLDTDDERWAPVFFALNGKLLITMQWPTQRAVVWDTTTWKLRRTLYEPRDRQATGPIADVSADGMNLACIGEDNSLQIWNLERLDEPVRINSGIGDVMSIAFDYDGKTVALGAISGAIHIWNLQAGQEILVLTGNRSYAGSLAFSPDGTGLASAGFDRTLRMWRAPSWEQINR